MIRGDHGFELVEFNRIGADKMVTRNRRLWWGRVIQERVVQEVRKYCRRLWEYGAYNP